MKTNINGVRTRIIIIVLVLCVVFTILSGCSGGAPKGTYKSQGLISQTFTFSDDKVTMSAFGINANGTYKINGSNITITYSLFGTSYDWTQPYEKSGNTIKIGGTEFVKE